MTDEAAYQLALKLFRAGTRGEAMPDVPALFDERQRAALAQTFNSGRKFARLPPLA